MIVQTAPQGEPHFVIRQIDHAHTTGMLAVHFGNQKFASMIPRDIMEAVISHHDQGWETADAAPQMDPKTGLPYHLGQTPLDTLLKTNQESPTFNEKKHPFAVVIVSLVGTVIHPGWFKPFRIERRGPIGHSHRTPIRGMVIKCAADIEYIDTKLIKNRKIRLCQLLNYIIDLNRQFGPSKVFHQITVSDGRDSGTRSCT